MPTVKFFITIKPLIRATNIVRKINSLQYPSHKDTFGLVKCQMITKQTFCCCCCCSVTSVVSDSVRPHR